MFVCACACACAGACSLRRVCTMPTAKNGLIVLASPHCLRLACVHSKHDETPKGVVGMTSEQRKACGKCFVFVLRCCCCACSLALPFFSDKPDFSR